MDNLENFKNEFVDNACFRMDESLRMIAIALKEVDEETIWKRPNASSNSIGNLMLHLCGNITQYGIASLNKEEDSRNRDLEFSTQSGYKKEELLELLAKTIEKAKATFTNSSHENLLDKRNVQGFEFSGLGNIVHVVEHLSYHTGQIAFWVKLLKDTPLGFYDGMDLNKLNEE